MYIELSALYRFTLIWLEQKVVFKLVRCKFFKDIPPLYTTLDKKRVEVKKQTYRNEATIGCRWICDGLEEEIEIMLYNRSCSWNISESRKNIICLRMSSIC